MPLSDQLQASFGADGFDLTVSVRDLASIFQAVSPVPLSFDASATGGITDALANVDLSSLESLAQPIIDAALEIVPGLPGLDGLLGPIEAALSAARLATSGDLAGIVGHIDGAVPAASGVGLDGLRSSIGGLATLPSDPSVGALLQLVGALVPHLDIGAPGALLGGPVGGLVSLVQLVAGLMLVDSASAEIERAALLVASMLPADQIAGLVEQLRTSVGPGLPALLTAAPPDDADAVAVVAEPALAFVANVRLVADLVVRGLAFGEATLVSAGFTGLAARLEAGTLLLSESALAPVGGLARTAVGWCDPFLRIALPAPNPFDAVFGQITDLTAPIVAAVNGLDPATIGRPVRDVLDTVLAPIHTFEQIASQIVTTLRSAFQPVHAVLDALDLRPLQEAVNTVLGPVSSALEALAKLIEDAQAAIEAGAQAVLDVITPVQDALHAVADTVRGAFQGLADLVESLGLADLQDTLREGIDAVAGALHAAQLKPVFDVAIGIIDTGADLLGAVPKALLPDDLRQDLEAACAPVEAMDLEPVREELRTELAGIVSAIDTDVLDDLEAAFADVVAFLDTIDPEPPLTELEHQTFDEMVARLRDVDPTVPLADVLSALDEVKAAVAGFDLRALLQPVEDALDEVVHALDAISIDELIAPVEEQLTAFRTWVEETTGISTWADHLAAVDTAVTALAARLDPARLLATLDQAWDDLIAQVRGAGGPPVLGTLVSGLVGGSVEPESFAEVISWVRGERDGSTVVRERLRRALATLSAVQASVGALDVAAVTSELDAVQRSVLDALTAAPEDSLIRRHLELPVRLASPVALLGSTPANQDRYASELADAVGVLQLLAPSDRGEVTAIAFGLRQQVRPLDAVAAKAGDVLAVVGLQPSGGGPRAALADALEKLPPSRLLAPLVTLADAVRAKLEAFVHEGIVAPLTDAVATIQGALDAIDLSFLSDEVRKVHDELVAKIEAIRPSAVLHDVLGALDDAKAAIVALDPLGPVRAVVDLLKAAIDQVATDLRPTVVLKPVLDVYHELRDALGALAVRELLQPVLDALDGIAAQLEDGMDGVVTALEHLQSACESDGPSIPDIGISVDVGIGL
jgi:hypothetical protein